MPTDKKGFHIISNFLQDTNIQNSDFEKEYKEYKLYDKKIFDFEFLGYKFKILIYASILIISIFFIMLGIFLWITNIIKEIFMVYLVLFIFAYTSFFGLYLMRREQRRFKSILLKMYEKQFV